MRVSLGKVHSLGGPSQMPGGARPTVVGVAPEAALEELRVRQATHPFWDGRLLTACRQGQLSREDLAPIFSQYYLLCRAEERCLEALLAQCEGESARARLVALAAEEAAAPPARRPLELLRRFLRDGLGVDVEGLRCQDATHHLVHESLDFCGSHGVGAGSAFLALGTEAVRPRLYGVFVEGLLHAGVAERHLRYFHLHMAVDGSRARVLEELLLAHAHAPGWYASSQRALERALELRGAFFDSLFEAVPHRRVGPLLARLQAGQAPASAPRSHHVEDAARGASTLRSVHAPRGIDFSVERVPFESEVLETRLLRVAPGQGSEPQQHPHETVLAVLSGTGRVRINTTEVEVRPGQLVFVPRWASLQAHGTGETELTLLEVTDQGLVARAHPGEYLKATRLARAVDGEG